MHNKAESDRRRYDCLVGNAGNVQRFQYNYLDQIVSYLEHQGHLDRHLRVYDRHTQRTIYDGPARRFVEE